MQGMIDSLVSLYASAPDRPQRDSQLEEAAEGSGGGYGTHAKVSAFPRSTASGGGTCFGFLVPDLSGLVGEVLEAPLICDGMGRSSPKSRIGKFMGPCLALPRVFLARNPFFHSSILCSTRTQCIASH